MDEGSWLSWLIVILLIFSAAYFAVSETSLASVSKIKIKTRLDKGDRRAKKVIFILDNFDRAITTILICTNVVHIAMATLVTVLVTRIWGLSFVAVAAIITTIAVFLFGEMLPKSIGKKYSERFSLTVAGSLCFFMLILKPISSVLTRIGIGVAKLTQGDMEVTVTEDELYDIIETMKDEGELDAQKGKLVHSALIFADVTVDSILTSRVDVAALDVEESQEDILSYIKEQRHSRLPVYKDSIDNIIGILQIRKYIKAYIKQGPGLDIESLLDKPYFVHQSANIDELLPEMSRKKINIAVVMDNYGGTVGIVTIEDILEELVGEIWDEDDIEIENFVGKQDGSFEINAQMDMEIAFALMGYRHDDCYDWDHKLIGKWAYEQFDFIPREGDKFRYKNLEVTVSEMKQQRILKLNVRILPHEEETGGEKL